MRSQLTRNVYRRLLAGHGLLRPCPALSGRCMSTCRPRPFQLVVRRPTRRTFFGIFQKPPRELKEPELEPGYETLLKFGSMETENARPPDRDVLLRGLRQLIQHKKRYHKTLNPTQALLTVRLIRYLLETPPEGESEDLSIDDLRLAFEVALKAPKGDTEDHLELAKLLYEEIAHRARSMEEFSKDIDVETTREAVVGRPDGDFHLFLTALTQYGASVEAAERLTEHWRKLQDENAMYKGAKAMWTTVLQGLAKEGKEEELLSTYQKAMEADVQFMPRIHEIMTTFFAARDRVEETKQWFEKPIYGKWPSTPETYLELARFAVRKKQQQWIQPIFEQLINTNPSKLQWDIILQWAVIAMDKSVEDIKQMITVMGRQVNQKQKPLEPDATTIDGLIKAAIEKQNPYLAERFLSLGSELGISPKSSTYILQMDYRLDAKDIGGAHAIYEKLKNGEVEVWNDEDLPVLNKYLRTLAAVPEPNIDRMLDITNDLEERSATLEPETVVGLCMVFLKSDQQYDVIDTLSLHTVSYSLAEREKVRKAFVQYCLNKKISTARVWDGYSLLRQFFPETESEDRIRLMAAFFERKRPDMACHIFGHMRAHGNPIQRPTADVYVQCLEGLGRYPHEESLRMLHNMLKMDTTVEMNTKLYNALMIAYAAAEETNTALGFWDHITSSVEGPSYNSLAAVFWACELAPWGDRTAREIWQKIQRMDLEVPPKVFWSYCGAIAAADHVEEVKRLIQGMDASVGYPPNTMTLGVTYNALRNPHAKQLFQDWAKEEYPDIWARLERKGIKKTISGNKFEITRNMEA